MSNRVHTIESIATEACAKAIAFNQDGRPGRAEYELVRAGIKIAKIVDDEASLERLSELRLFEPFRDPRLGDGPSRPSLYLVGSAT